MAIQNAPIHGQQEQATPKIPSPAALRTPEEHVDAFYRLAHDARQPAPVCREQTIWERWLKSEGRRD